MDEPADNIESGDQSDSQPVLLLELDKKTLTRYRLNRPRLRLGRSSNCDIVLSDSTGVSREHAQILVIDGEVVVEDLDSRNGTFVNKISCERRTLRPGDRISIGQYRLHFQLEQYETRVNVALGNEIATLLALWARAGVAEKPDSCPLCGSSAGLPETLATGEHCGIDDEEPEVFAEPAAEPESAAVESFESPDSPEIEEQIADDEPSCIVLMPD